MKEKDFYYTIGKTAAAEFKDRGSKFIALAYPLEDAGSVKQILAEVKDAYPKATHYCFAWRTGIDGTKYRVSDDGEPSGSAGRPILGQIDSRQLTNTLVIVVRYFGGTLLGVPGLINAYKTAAALALQVTTILQKPVEKNWQLHFDYTSMNEVMMVVKQFNCTVIRQESQLFCTMVIGIPVNRREEVLFRLKAIRNMELKETD